MSSINDIQEFSYDPSHLHLKLQILPMQTQSNHENRLFDNILLSKWFSAMTAGLFRYTLPTIIPFTILSGRYSFILQLNPDRGSKRREAQLISTLSQPFDPHRFNFNRVPQEEVLLHLKPWWDAESSDQHLLLINVSPLEKGHVLVTPYREQGRVQALSVEGLRLSLNLILLSCEPDFRLGFNSLCGYASVNHEHYHAYYLKHRLYLESAALLPLACCSLSFGPFELKDYPAPGLVWTLEKLEDCDQVVAEIMKVAKYLHSTDTAHNLFITRGAAGPRNSSNSCEFTCLRVFLWARESSFGAKESDGFNPAVCELAGHFPCKSESSYTSLNEEGIIHILRGLTVKQFSVLRSAIINNKLNS